MSKNLEFSTIKMIFKATIFRHIFVALLFGFSILNAKPDAIITSERTTSDTVEMGMCLLNEEIIHTFTILNIGDTPLKFGTNARTLAEFQIPGRPFENYEFNHVSVDTATFQPGEKRIINIKFSSTLGLFGTLMCRLRLGAFNPSKVTDPLTDDELVKFRDFILVAHRAKRAIEGFQKVIDFDSVWVMPADTQKRYWSIQNNTLDYLTIKSLSFERYLFSKINHYITTPFDVTPKNKMDFLITYFPKSKSDDWGRDTANLKLIYNPYPPKADSLDTVEVSIYGVGVLQRIELQSVDSNAIIQGNTIVVNDVPSGEYRDIKILIQNNGNLPFGIKYQKLLEMGSQKPAEGMTIIRPLSTQRNFLQTEIDTIIIRFKPDDQTSIFGRYIIGSDIFSRKVHGAPDSSSEVVFFIRGTGVAPEISVANDTINFGNIVINQGDCPAFRDSSITVSNNGNLFLRVNKITMEPEFPGSPFNVMNENLDIPPKSSRQLRLKFDTLAKQPIRYNATVVLASNSKPPKDTIRIHLSAMGIYPDTTNLIIPNIRSKPSRRILIPILANKEKLKIAKSYTDTIYFDKSLLKFYGVITKGTANEFMTHVEAFEAVEGGKIYISTGKEFIRYFEQSDTLLLLVFDTFLGEKLSTPIYFSKAKFGDGICSNILTPQTKDGLFTLDSICGLENKISKLPKGKFRLEVESVNSNPEYASVFFSTPFEETIEINIYNSYGEKISCLVNEKISEGDFIRKLPISELIPGVYYCEMKAGIFRNVKPLLISK